MIGRPPAIGTPRGVYLRVRLSKSESERLERQRGELNRSDYVRKLLSDAPEKG